MTLIESKGLLKSKTVWGGLIALIPVVSKVLESVGVVPPGVIDASVELITSTLGGVLAIWGRVSAKQKVEGLF